MVNDSSNTISKRIDAYILYAWIGTIDETVEEIYDLSPWAAQFILDCFKDYPTIASMMASTSVHYDNAMMTIKECSEVATSTRCDAYDAFLLFI